ncbi:MAG TPA: CpaF family protein [Phycisphaerae bacterium]|nr:CpaF family protein [Phycisphaerae bacterium]HUT61746.1 CpaF family protein [Phycisphaerae bacterium]
MAKMGIFQTTVDHFLAPIKPFLEDPAVSEIMVNSPDEIYVERQGQLVRTDARFEDDQALLAAVNNVLQFTGKRLTSEHPLVDSRLPDGSRVHVILAPLCRNGTAMCIRKFSRVMFSAQHLIELGSWTPEVMEYLRVCVLAEKNILVGGGTSSGKTCLLNVLSGFIPEHQRIVVIEDSSELQLQQDHVISLEGRSPDRWGKGAVMISDLFRSSLRLRPDRIIIGEVRGGEALDVIQSMTSGHAGSMTTLHANMAMDALSRLETLAMMSKIELPLHALRAQVASAIDVIVQVTRFNDGRRALTQVSEVLPLGDDGKYRLQDMFTYQIGEDADGRSGRGRMVWTGSKSSFRGEAKVRITHDIWDLTKVIFQAD